MKRLINLVVAVLLLVLLLAYMMSYTVRFNETAIVTTFGSAGENSVVNGVAEDGTVGAGAGLHFKWPWPIQQVARKFDTRIQTFEGPLEQWTTADNQTIMVSTYVNWRVVNPLNFYNSLGTMNNAENRLFDRVRDASNDIANYSFSDLVNDDPTQLKLNDISRGMRDRIQDGVDSQSYGISVEQVGIKRLVLPPSVTQSVFERMREERNQLANSIVAEGTVAERNTIQTAQANASTILSFADTKAAETRAEGEREAVRIRTSFRQDEAFAVYLKAIDAWEQALAGQTRFYIDASKVFPFSMFEDRMGSSNDQLDTTAADTTTAAE